MFRRRSIASSASAAASATMLLLNMSSASSRLLSATRSSTFVARATKSDRKNSAAAGDEDDDADLESVDTATGIARALRNYRQATPQSQEGTWIDLENLMSTRHVAGGAMSSSGGGGSSSSSAPKLRPLQTAEEIISGSAAFRAAGLELRAELLVRLKHPRRAANIFIDTDGMTPQQAAHVVAGLQLQEQHSTISIVRQAATQPHFGDVIRETCRFRSFTTVLPDEIVPRLGTSSSTASSSSNRTSENNNNNGSSSASAGNDASSVVINSSSFQLPTYMIVEKLAAKLALAHTVVLNDVIFICSDANLSLYCDHVAKATSFLDADVFVCTPSRSDQVHYKMPAPSVSPTLTVPCGK